MKLTHCIGYKDAILSGTQEGSVGNVNKIPAPRIHMMPQTTHSLTFAYQLNIHTVFK